MSATQYSYAPDKAADAPDVRAPISVRGRARRVGHALMVRLGIALLHHVSPHFFCSARLSLFLLFLIFLEHLLVHVSRTPSVVMPHVVRELEAAAPLAEVEATPMTLPNGLALTSHHSLLSEKEHPGYKISLSL